MSESPDMTENTPQHKLYPMMPLRDLVIFPHMVAPLIVGRGKSIKALEHAMSNRVEIFLSTQLDSSIDEPQGKDVHPIGTIANVLQLLRLPDGTIKALVEGKQRARIIGFVPNQQFFMVQAEPIIESSLPGYHSIAYRRELH
ncbi:MAG: LON peptidase substrate-binding domain-containing protein, partial [Desulfobulbaceae bacterium]|nr:LON peptidase substrate-binding domain-containing protein [Desulfobulbaceae bacterium]